MDFRSHRVHFLAAALIASVVLSTGLPSRAGVIDETAGLALWLDATDAATLTVDGANNVSEWRDKSGGGHDAATGSSFPVLQANAIGGLPAVRFNRDPLTIAAGIPVAADQDRTAFAVMSYGVQTQNSELFGTSTGNMVDVGNWDRPQRLRLRQSDNAFSAANALPLGSHVLAIQGDAGGSRAWSDGTQIIDTADKRFHWNMAQSMQVGGAHFGGREYVGDLAELVVYDRQLNPFETNAVGYELQQKYSLPGNYVNPASLGGSTLPVTGGVQLWLDATDPATLTFNGVSGVAEWRDKSGNANHATAGGPEPQLTANAIGGMPAVSFNREPLDIAGGLDIAAGQDRTAFVVMSYDTLTNNNEIFGTSTVNMVDVGNWSSSERLRFRQSDSLFSDPGSLPVGNHLLVLQGDAAGTRAWSDGASLVDSTDPRFHWAMNTNMQMGGANFAGRQYIGDLGEVIIYDRSLDAAEIKQVGAYLETKYRLLGTYSAPVSDGLAMWLDASASHTLAVDGAGKVTTWVDRTGNGHDATPLGSLPAPQYVASGINGMPALDFSRSARNVMGIAGDFGLAAGDERTIFVVMDYDALFGNNEILGTSTGDMIDVGTWTPSGHQSDRLRLRSEGGTNAFSAAGDFPRGTHILAIIANADGTLALSDGTPILDTDLLAQHYAMGTNLKIGGANFSGRDYDGLIAEILLYDRALSVGEWNEVGLYLANKYGIETAFVPEPATLSLLALGGLALLRRRRRRR